MGGCNWAENYSGEHEHNFVAQGWARARVVHHSYEIACDDLMKSQCLFLESLGENWDNAAVDACLFRLGTLTFLDFASYLGNSCQVVYIALQT